MEENTATEGPVAYGKKGEGPGTPVVFLHAFPLDSGMWEPQLSTLASEGGAAGARPFVTLDYPGFGRSPRVPAQPDVGYYARCVRKLLDQLGLDRAVLCGLSMGGYVAFECLRRFPERVAGLVLANTRPDPDSEEARQSRNQAARRVAEDGVEALIELQMPRLLSEKTLQEKPEVVDAVKAMISRCSPAGAVAALSAMRERPDSTSLLPQISVPTLVLGGAEDAISTPEVMGAMAREIPHARHLTLEDAGHLSNLETPEAFNEALREFLAEL